jgi:flagellar hook-basal body complex protein FliE
MSLTLSATSALPELSMRPSQGAAQPAMNATGGDGFAETLRKFTAEAAATLRQGEAAALGGISGSLPLQTVVDRIMAAERTLQTTLAVRDKAVTAYLEISRMQI